MFTKHSRPPPIYRVPTWRTISYSRASMESLFIYLHQRPRLSHTKVTLRGRKPDKQGKRQAKEIFFYYFNNFIITVKASLQTVHKAERKKSQIKEILKEVVHPPETLKDGDQGKETRIWSYSL